MLRPPLSTFRYLSTLLWLVFIASGSAPVTYADTQSTDQSAVSDSVAVNLIRRLVERGALTAQDGADLIKLAEADAAKARDKNTKDMSDDDTVRVTYVPQSVKDQIRAELKQDVLAEAKHDKWAQPNTFPSWVTRFALFGDFRMRYEGLLYPTGNNNTGAFPNFNAINTGAPFDVSGTQFSPQYDVDQNRSLFRIRARFGADVTLADGFSTGFRLASGNDSQPVSGNQTLGGANQAQGGDFSKYAVWIDRAFIKYQINATTDKAMSATLGRFENPFSNTVMLWADDLGFDGAVVNINHTLFGNLASYVTAGAFPIFNTDLNFPSNQPYKYKSEDKWLYGLQVGFRYDKLTDVSLKGSAALYYFDQVNGKLSTPYTPLTSSDMGNTDDSRPSYAQSGNTYMPVRNIISSALNNYGAINQYQYFGLASSFNDVVLDGQVDFTHFLPKSLSLNAEYVNNIAFHKGHVAAKAVNNYDNSTTSSQGVFGGGNQAWLVGLKWGDILIKNSGDWNVGLNYRYVESDSLIDGFCDSDFGGTMPGTNHKGYTFTINYGLSQGVWLNLRWMSADQVAGPTYKNDMLLLDINTKF
jgi:Putative porin